jgi:hypothetical protein
MASALSFHYPQFVGDVRPNPTRVCPFFPTEGPGHCAFLPYSIPVRKNRRGSRLCENSEGSKADPARRIAPMGRAVATRARRRAHRAPPDDPKRWPKRARSYSPRRASSAWRGSCQSGRAAFTRAGLAARQLAKVGESCEIGPGGGRSRAKPVSAGPIPW